MNKPSKRFARPLADFVKPCLGDTFSKQGFASGELVTRWADIVGPEIAAHCEPIRMQWSRNANDAPPDPATLVLRVEGPVAIEIQHMSGIILERVNQFFGWQAVGRLALRQAPLSPRPKPTRAKLDLEAASRVAATLTGVENEELRQALARLGAAVREAK
jgi:hypothetical protein